MTALLLLCLWLAPSTNAGELPLPDSLAASALSETRPGGRTPFDLDPQDIVLEWTDQPLDGVTLRILPESVSWVRTASVLVVPTAQLEVVASSVSAGTVQSAGFQQALQITRGDGRAVLPIALLTGPYNPVRISVIRDGVPHAATVMLESARRGLPRIARDTSCSTSRLTWSATGAFEGDWVYLGCRVGVAQGEGGRTPSLELYALWDGPAAIATGGVATVPTLTNTWTYRLRPEPGRVTLRDEDGDTLELSYRLRPRSHDGVIGVTLGPALTPTSMDLLAPAFFIRPHVIIAFDARQQAVLFDTVVVNPEGWINDAGGYYGTPLFSLADQRIQVSTLLGMHLQTYPVRGRIVSRYSLPQGLDIHIPDAFVPSWWLRTGAFIQPRVGQSYYYQGYVRFGPRSYVELNYTDWKHRDRQHQRLSLLFGGQLVSIL